MIKKLLFTGITLMGFLSRAQECPGQVLISPLSGAVNVAVDTEIRWNGVAGVPAYIISIGTTPFGSEILTQNVGNATSYTPPLGLPENTEIFVTLTLYFFQPEIPNIVCTSESFTTGSITSPPPCTSLSSPVNGSMNVNVASNLNWNYSPTANSYDLSVGTSPGAGDIFSGSVGNVTSYDPGDFPPNMTIYVTIIPRNNVGRAVGCTEQSFTTGALATVPDCTSLVSPADGAINVPLSPLIEWQAVPGASGYKVTIGLTPFTSEVLDNATFLSNTTFVIEFEPNRTFFVRIIPYNTAGEAIGCVQESFSTLLGCGPFFDPVSGGLITLNPEITLPDAVASCMNSGPQTLTAPDMADGYRWFRVDSSGNETLISEESTVILGSDGQYRYEAYNLVTQAGNSVECSSSRIFEVFPSETATITSIDVSGPEDNLRIAIQAEGSGDYEYALDSAGGPYRQSPVFENVLSGNHTVYVRDRNGCGTVSQSIEEEIVLDGFPPFFTPNGDGINDYWQFIPPPDLTEFTLKNISIFDRYGRLIARISPVSEGWDGTYKGRPLPSDDYWFRAEMDTEMDLQGHFTLKR